MTKADTYTFEIRVIRNPRDENDKPKPISTLSYHNLNYGALVGIEREVTDKLMPALSELGVKMAASLGFELPPISE